jgi:hypothetical protein
VAPELVVEIDKMNIADWAAEIVDYETEIFASG